MKKEEEQTEVEATPKAERKAQERESVERRKRLKRADRAARWSGFILLITTLLLSALMWVIGEIRTARGASYDSDPYPQVITR